MRRHNLPKHKATNLTNKSQLQGFQAIQWVKVDYVPDALLRSLWKRKKNVGCQVQPLKVFVVFTRYDAKLTQAIISLLGLHNPKHTLAKKKKYSFLDVNCLFVYIRFIGIRSLEITRIYLISTGVLDFYRLWLTNWELHVCDLENHADLNDFDRPC